MASTQGHGLQHQLDRVALETLKKALGTRLQPLQEAITLVLSGVWPVTDGAIQEINQQARHCVRNPMPDPSKQTSNMIGLAKILAHYGVVPSASKTPVSIATRSSQIARSPNGDKDATPNAPTGAPMVESARHGYTPGHTATKTQQQTGAKNASIKQNIGSGKHENILTWGLSRMNAMGLCIQDLNKQRSTDWVKGRNLQVSYDTINKRMGFLKRGELVYVAENKPARLLIANFSHFEHLEKGAQMSIGITSHGYVHWVDLSFVGREAVNRVQAKEDFLRILTAPELGNCRAPIKVYTRDARFRDPVFHKVACRHRDSEQKRAKLREVPDPEQLS